MIISETIKTEVCGLFGVEIIEVSPFKEMETKCLKDYFSIEKKYPEWNFQENNEVWYERIREKYDYVKNAK